MCLLDVNPHCRKALVALGYDIICAGTDLNILRAFVSACDILSIVGI